MFGSSSQLDKHWFFNRAIALGSACSLELRKIDSIWMDHCMALYDIWACCLFWWLQEYTLAENSWKMYLRQERSYVKSWLHQSQNFLRMICPFACHSHAFRWYLREDLKVISWAATKPGLLGHVCGATCVWQLCCESNRQGSIWWEVRSKSWWAFSSCPSSSDYFPAISSCVTFVWFERASWI